MMPKEKAKYAKCLSWIGTETPDADRSSAERQPSPLWNRALERYLEELEANDEASYQEIITSEATSIDDVLDYAKTLESLLPRERGALTSLNRLGPILKFVDDFSAAIAICFGADAKLTAFVWGSIRLILTLSSSAGDNFRNVLDMLEELSLRFRIYEQTLPMDKALEAALLDLYTEVICFYARTIHFFRRHPHTLLLQNAWSDFQGDFSRTLRRIKRMSATVESEADQARMRIDKSKYSEVLDVLQCLKDCRVTNEPAVPQCYLVPHQPNPRFWGREHALQEVRSHLEGAGHNTDLKAFALHGMGGVGKTQIALQYADKRRSNYDVVLWVAADNIISVGQSMRDIAQSLGLINTDNELKDTLGASLKVKKWLQDASECFRYVFGKFQFPTPAPKMDSHRGSINE
jgi:NB-ARC domain